MLRALYLGDLLCATPALRALRHRFPHAEITLIGLPWVRQLIERLPSVDRFEPFPGYPGLPEVPFEPPATIAFLEWARQQRFELAVQMHGSGPASNEFVSELRSGMSLGFRRDRGDPLTVGLPWQEDEHEVYRWLRLVGELGADADPTLDFPISPLEMTAADKLLGYQTVSGERLIGLHVGAKDPARRWPPARFAALADRLTRAIDCRFVLTGTSAEQKLVDEAAQAMAAPGLNLVGQTNLGTLAGVLGRLDLLVTNDTGASHLAEAVGTPSVVLFGPTAPARWAPLDQRLHCPVDARGVNGSTRDGAAALANLPIDPVFSACVEQLAMRDERTAEQLVDDAAVGSAREALCRA